MEYVSHAVEADGLDITYKFGNDVKHTIVPFQKIGITETLRSGLHAELIRLLPADAQKLFNT